MMKKICYFNDISSKTNDALSASSEPRHVEKILYRQTGENGDRRCMEKRRRKKQTTYYLRRKRYTIAGGSFPSTIEKE